MHSIHRFQGLIRHFRPEIEERIRQYRHQSKKEELVKVAI
jgi:hypothetical protein